MKVSEKSLELNVGAEKLYLVRGAWGHAESLSGNPLRTQHGVERSGRSEMIWLDSELL